LLIALIAVTVSSTANAEERVFFAGADVSMLPEIERAGGVFRDATGRPADALRVMRDAGINLFRVRLFVNPDHDFRKNYGATQDLPYVRELAKRIKATGAQFLLDIHYSDSWADPGKQRVPAAWKQLDDAGIEQRVHDYTLEVLADLKANHAEPQLVQIGNEITAGMLWPHGQITRTDDAAGDERQWKRFAQLVNAGSRAVRESQDPSRPIRIIVHIHGGGHPGLPQWFFGKFDRGGVDYDVIGLSCYPAWKDSLDALKQNMSQLIERYEKDVMVVEASYPWKTTEGIKDQSVMKWPLTPQGQAKFISDMVSVMRAAPQHKGVGAIWWYPDALPVQGLQIWRNGAEALFDEVGAPLPALAALGQAGRRDK
jgi:arabinogalactan endo-1,4-beta-galactosidase